MNHEIPRNNVPTLLTERLVLAPLTQADLNSLHRVSNEPLVRRYLWDDEPVQEDAIRVLIAQSVRTFAEEGVGLFGVRLRGGESVVGFCGFVLLPGMEEVELAFELTTELWGGGLATEAARVCVRHAFEAAGLRRVIAGADQPNVASLRVLGKLGMRPIGNINPLAPPEPYYALYNKRSREMSTETNILIGPDQGGYLPELDITHKVTAEASGGSLKIEEWSLPPGQMIPPHSHAREDECSFVLEGELLCYVGGEVVLAPQGSYVLKPRGVPHAFYNTGAGTVRVMEILTPGESFEGYFDKYEEIVSRKRSDEEHRRARAELGERYGITWHDEMIPEVEARFGMDR